MERAMNTCCALESMAAVGSHVPGRGQQPVLCNGAYANSTPGRQQEREAEEPVSNVPEPNLFSREGNGNGSCFLQRNNKNCMARILELDFLGQTTGVVFKAELFLKKGIQIICSGDFSQSSSVPRCALRPLPCQASPE
jgi:hypothetical protein